MVKASAAGISDLPVLPRNSEKPSLVLLYANQPVQKAGTRFFTQNKNFVDFLAVLSRLSDDYRLVVPVRHMATIRSTLMEADLPPNCVQVAAYGSHPAAIFASLRNLPLLVRIINRARKSEKAITVAGPGPNSTLFFLSYLIPSNVRYVFFIRGNTVETVRRIYEASALRHIAVPIVRMFRQRIRDLLAEDRAIALAYGPKLARRYGRFGKAYAITPLIEAEVLLHQSPRRPRKPSDPLRIVYVGRLSREKQVSGLINAVDRLLSEGQSCSLTIVGYGPEETFLREVVSHSNLEEHISFRGFIPHGQRMFQILDSHDLLCLPSLTEGTPRVVVEASARFLPVLSTPVGSLPELFSTSIRFTSGFDEAAIADGIRWCRGHPAECERMAETARGAVDKYLITTQAKHVDKLIRKSRS